MSSQPSRECRTHIIMIQSSMQSSCTSLWGTSNPHLEVSWNYLFPGNYSIFIYSPHTDSKLYTDFLVMHSYLSGILQKQVTELMHSSTTLVCGIELILWTTTISFSYLPNSQLRGFGRPRMGTLVDNSKWWSEQPRGIELATFRLLDNSSNHYTIVP